MKIFVLLPRIPWPLEKGDKLRAFNQIKQLAKNNEVVLCALNTDKKVSKEDAFKALQPYCISVTFIDISKLSILINISKAFFKGLPLQCGYFYNRIYCVFNRCKLCCKLYKRFLYQCFCK